ncbi:MAG: 50S ribosomal protein L25 [Gemmataceae bacterium]|nr:50S ribosomal protein L25 [Gemmataceae bacterium]MDW8264653.1 50S ribosomal protein L25 [Gemmataceae bacterium]
MTGAVEIQVSKRSAMGKQAVRRLRRTGMVPGVIYGHKEQTVAIQLPADELAKVLRRGTRVVDVKTDGRVEKALIREVQWDHLGKELLHVDFYRVAADERIVVTVPVEVRGTAPGLSAGGVLDQPMHTLAIECLAVRIPESIRVNVGELQLGQAIHVRDLVLPPDVRAMADPEAVVVQVKTPQAEVEAAEAAGPAEPEVIGRAKAEEEPAE